MRSDPVPTAAQAHAAAARIVERRTAAPCPDLAQLDDSLPGVVQHVARHGDTSAGTRGRDIAPELLAPDVVDALLVLDYLDDLWRRRLARTRLGVIAAGRRAGLGPSALMRPLHQRNRQGVTQVVARLRAYLDPLIGTADASRERTARRAAAHAATANARDTDDLVAVAEQLAALADRLPADYDDAGVDVDDITGRAPAPGQPVSPAFIATLRLLVHELADRQELDAELRGVVDHAAQLLSRRG